MFKDVINFIQEIYQTKEFIPLHEPKFRGNEKKYLNECIESTFVSSVGKFVDLFEKKIAEYTSAKYAIATTNGTSALHIALLLASVDQGDEVITQPLTFVGTCNAIKYCGANPIFVDVDLRACQMMGAKITNAKLNGDNLYNTILHDVEMPGLVLKGKLSRFIANDCTFDEIDASYLEMNRCIFHKCSLKGADLSNSIFNEVTFSNVDFTNTNLDEITIDKTLFQEVDFSDRDFSKLKMFIN